MARKRLLVLVACLTASVFLSAPAARAVAGEKRKAPSFGFTDRKGENVTLEKLLARSKVVLVNFWGLRCSACLEELPSLNVLQEKYRGAGLRVLGVNTDGLSYDVLASQMRKGNVTIDYEVVADPEMKVVDAFQMLVAPLTLIIDSGGNVAYSHEGFNGDADAVRLDAEIKKVLGAE